MKILVAACYVRAAGSRNVDGYSTSSFRPPSISLALAVRRLPRRAIHHMSRSRKNTDQAARQILKFGEAVPSARRGCPALGLRLVALLSYMTRSPTKCADQKKSEFGLVIWYASVTTAWLEAFGKLSGRRYAPHVGCRGEKPNPHHDQRSWR
jgi:hypothetical protein